MPDTENAPSILVLRRPAVEGPQQRATRRAGRPGDAYQLEDSISSPYATAQQGDAGIFFFFFFLTFWGFFTQAVVFNRLPQDTEGVTRRRAAVVMDL